MRMIKNLLFFLKKGLTNSCKWFIINKSPRYRLAVVSGSIAQLGEHLPYKQRVTGSSPVVPTISGLVVQLVRMPACHAGGRGFEPLPGRHLYALVAQSVEQQTENLRVGGSIPPQGTVCGSSSVVECHLAKVDVAGPNPVYRSTPGAIAKW